MKHRSQPRNPRATSRAASVHQVIATIACLGLVGCLAACGATTPLWYEGEQDHWTLPLAAGDFVEPVVPVMVHGQGPYLFALDPDSPASVIDEKVARSLNLYSNQQYFRILNQKDVTVPRRTYEVLELDTGDLRIRKTRMLHAPEGSLRASGQVVHGILGGDLLSRTIVIDIDRDAGHVRLSRTGTAAVPETAVGLHGWLHRGWLYVPVRVGDRQVTMQVRPSARVSTLRRKVLDKLAARPAAQPGNDTTVEVDETGTPLVLRSGGVIPTVSFESLVARDVHFYIHGDRRERDRFQYDGILGQDILSRFRVIIDRDHKTLYLAPRSPSAHNSR